MSLCVINTSQGIDETFSPKQKTPKLLITSTARAEKIPKSYKILLDLINTYNLRFIILCDRKIVNLLCRTQSHSSKHPFCWCDIDSEKGSLKTDHNRFVAAGSNKSNANELNNVIEASSVMAEDSQLVLDLNPLMEVVNHLFKKLLLCWPEARGWPAKLSIQMQPLHGGQFTGTDCSNLLKNVDMLQRMAEKCYASQAIGFVETFRPIRIVVNSC